MATGGVSTRSPRSRTAHDGVLTDLQVKVAGWRRERDSLVKQIRDVVAAAQSMLTEVNGSIPRAAASAGVAVSKPSRKRKRHFSPEARARMSEAAKRRWAKVRR